MPYKRYVSVIVFYDLNGSVTPTHVIWENSKGEKHSQYGSYWITNGEINIKKKKNDNEIPKGFYKGRTNKKRKIKGTYWITNGKINILKYPNHLNIPKGFYKGSSQNHRKEKKDG